MHPLPMPGGLEPVCKLWQFVVEPGGKQVHLVLVPLGAYSLEDLWVKGPFCLDSLT